MPFSRTGAVALAFAAVAAPLLAAAPATAAGYVPISGSGSTWSSNALDAWRRETSDDFGIDMLPGHHFFIHDDQALLLQLIVAALQRTTARSQRRLAPAES